MKQQVKMILNNVLAQLRKPRIDANSFNDITTYFAFLYWGRNAIAENGKGYYLWLFFTSNTFYFYSQLQDLLLPELKENGKFILEGYIGTELYTEFMNAGSLHECVTTYCKFLSPDEVLYDSKENVLWDKLLILLGEKSV